jgi:Tol biopolymer transport system component
MVATVAFLGAVGYYVLSLWKPKAEPLDTVLVAKNLRGNVGNLIYMPQGKQILFSQNLKGQWFLKIVDSENQAPVTVNLENVDGPFHTFLVDDGKTLLLDAPQGDERGLDKVDIASGTVSVLVPNGVEPFSGGVPWSESNGQFLFVTQDKKGFKLNSWSPDKAKPKVLFSSPTVMLAPSWINYGELAYVDGVHSTPYVLNVAEKTTTPVISDEDKKDQNEIAENDPLIEVLPSPDHFRYLCMARKDGQTTLWTMLMDGTKRVEIYKSNEQLSELTWHPDSQKIIFEKTGLERGFKNNIKGIKIIDANLLTIKDLMPPQVVTSSPAISPDGIKVAFVGSEGLWYPSLDLGIWVAVLR